jgi:hypothetical protein
LQVACGLLHNDEHLLKQEVWHNGGTGLRACLLTENIIWKVFPFYRIFWDFITPYVWICSLQKKYAWLNMLDQNSVG